FPEIAAEDDDGVAAGDGIFVVMEGAAELRLDAQDAEEIAGDEDAAARMRRRASLGAEGNGAQRGIGNDAVVTAGLTADVEVFAVGEVLVAVVARCADESDDAARMGHGVRAEEEAVDHAQAGGGHADAEGEGHGDEGGEGGAAAEGTDGVSEIVEEIGEPVDAAGVAD